MKLHWSAISPYARKVMIVAHETDCVSGIMLSRTALAANRPNPELLSINPLNKVPTLELDDGTILYDLCTICEYLDSLHDGEKLFPVEGVRRWDALRRQALGNGMMDMLLLWRQERLKPAERRTPELMDASALKIDAALNQLEQQAHGLAQKPFDIGHITLGCMLSYVDMRFGDLAWRKTRPHLAAWHEHFERRPSAAATKPELPAT